MTKSKIPERLKPAEFESKWQKMWEETGIYSPDMNRFPELKASNSGNLRRPYYNLMMFPYPSAEGLHVGNMYAFTGADVHGRFMRMRGFDVFEPIGLDGFGIHSENYALKVNRHPKEQAKISQANFYRQMRAIGNSFDWRRTIETYDPDYYRWTQWLFVQMFKHGLAYRAKAAVNWCPSCKTVLADEQVIDERCERCSSVVEKKDLEQWFFKITAYAERLLNNTFKPEFNWPEKVKIGQRNWIGKKEGINIKYQVVNVIPASEPGSQMKKIPHHPPASAFAQRLRAGVRDDLIVEVFTTTPVNFGATFLVLAPEHPAVLKITTTDQLKSVTLYIDTVKKMNPQDRIAKGKEKTGVFTGAYVFNHVTNENIPVWVSDFVLMNVGTGAIQGCPGHDMRDFEFAKKFGIPIKRVVVGPDGDSSSIEKPEQVIESGMKGTMINSDFLNGVEFKDAMHKTMDYFEKKGWGKRVTSYHLRDWLISRQRYWGAPIPMIYCESCAVQGQSWFIQNSPQPPLSQRGGVHVIPSLYERGGQEGFLPNAMPGWFPVPEDHLPVLLPDVENWRPTGTGSGPLAAVPEFYETICPHCGGKAKRETDVCDTFLDSAWYYLRYPSVSTKVQHGNSPQPPLSQRGGVHVIPPLYERGGQEGFLHPWDPEITRRWMPVDSYIGGAEHTVLHLLYTRFTWMALRDWEYLQVKSKTVISNAVRDPKRDSTAEGDFSPDGHRGRNDKDNLPFDPDEPFKRFYAHGLIIKDGVKMSKSKGNVVVPDEYIKLYGADTLRTYLMFLGPYDAGGDFRDSGIAGMYRWLSRVWRLALFVIPHLMRDPMRDSTSKGDFSPSLQTEIEMTSNEAKRVLAKTIKGVTEDLEKLHYNTAIAKMMEFTNWWMEHASEVDQAMVVDFIKLLAPFAPYMTEELFQKSSVVSRQSSDKFGSIHVSEWPKYDEALVQEETITIVIQVNGKTRDSFQIDSQKGNNEKEVQQLALESARVQKWLENKQIRKTIFVKGRIINFVV